MERKQKFVYIIYEQKIYVLREQEQICKKMMCKCGFMVSVDKYKEKFVAKTRWNFSSEIVPVLSNFYISIGIIFYGKFLCLSQFHKLVRLVQFA